MRDLIPALFAFRSHILIYSITNLNEQYNSISDFNFCKSDPLKGDMDILLVL